MVDKDYLSIADFAKQAGVTKQAIYLRLNKDLKPYLKELENKKYLKIEALELFGVKPLEQELETKYSSTLIDLADHLQKQYEQLQEQNKRFDRLIDDLEDELEIKNKQIEAYIRHLDQAHTLEAMTHAHALTGSTQEPVSEDDLGKKAKEYYQQKYIDDILEIGRILETKYPGAVDYLIEQAEKSGE